MRPIRTLFQSATLRGGQSSRWLPFAPSEARTLVAENATGRGPPRTRLAAFRSLAFP